jgi:hypothetical protein
MTGFLLLYGGPPPVKPTHEGWPEWFEGCEHPWRSVGREVGEARRNPRREQALCDLAL